MGTVGISFGSPTSGQGFDVSSTVSQIVANLQAIETPWQNQLTSLQSQDTALTSIGSDLSTLTTALQNLTDADGIFTAKEGSSSDNSVVEITGATTGAATGSHTVTVQSLASTSSYHSDAMASGDLLTGSLSISIDGGTAQTIQLGANGQTLSGVANAINSGDYGVTASVVNTSSGSVLTLVSSTSGSAGEISLAGSSITDTTSGSQINFTESQTGKDAQLTVDGLAITSGSNTVTNAISGVTLQLLSTSPTSTDESGAVTATPVQIEITNDDTDVGSAIEAFVSAYNVVVSDVNAQEGNDASGNPEPLDGNPTLASIQEQLEGALSFIQSSGTFTSLSQLGISATIDGTLSLDTDTLSSALNDNYQDVVNLFQPGSGFTSFGDNLTAALNDLGDTAPSGEIYLALQQNSSVESQLNTNISNENTQISTEQAQLTTELNEANQTLEAIPQELQSVDELYSAITGYNENSQG
ncbi:flagellar filament capping protein FliD [Silvibacterium acidisoli]|uniref:flagellar filament capping protein FliD n=1 Tax=Acidobacteriaceae bacterium ZG23-2 TaxID=2883246 RepID=UPI00406BF807